MAHDIGFSKSLLMYFQFSVIKGAPLSASLTWRKSNYEKSGAWSYENCP